MARKQPRWVTPERQAYLLTLFSQSQGFCIYGHRPCLIPEHHYQLYIEGVISNWVSDDRADSVAIWQAERRALHRLAERTYPRSGQFDAISKDIFFADQPQFYIEGLAVSGITFRAFAKVRVSSSFVALHIDIGDTLKSLSKSKRRKALRYGKQLPEAIQKELNHICRLAVEHYLNH